MKKSKLPLEIEDTIMNLYWKSIFYNKIILFLIHKKHKIINYNINNINYYKDIEDDFKYITYYLCVLSGYNRFQIINALKKLIIHFMC